MATLIQQTVVTKSQRHWRAWVSALQTRDASVRAVALEQLSKFLDYWTGELYSHASIRGLTNGHDTPQESWDEVFNVDTDLLIRSRRPQVRFGSIEGLVLACSPLNQVGQYGSDETAADSQHVEAPPSMNPWDNDDGSKETRETLSQYYCGIQRLVIDCPFADVRRSCRKLLDKARRKHVEIPSLVNESPSWLIPLSEIIGFKTENHSEVVTLQIHNKYISDESSSSDSDIEFRSRTTEIDESHVGYGYYTSPDATPRPTFTTPAIPINGPPRSRSRTRHIIRTTSQESLALSITSHSERKFIRQRLANNDTREFQISAFIAHGRVTNYAKVLFFMPRYLRCTSTCYERLVSSTKGMARFNKTYIALLAAAESGCQYFVSYFTTKFLEVGGDSNWLKGIESTPGKVQRISELNRKMIAEPWNITHRDVSALTETHTIDEVVEEGWSVGDVVQMMTILGIFHAQSTIALATGVVCEADVFGGTIWRKFSRATPELEGSTDENPIKSQQRKKYTARSGRDEIIEKLKMKMLGSGHMSPDMSFDNLEALRIESSRHENVRGRATQAAFLECLEHDPFTANENDESTIGACRTPDDKTVNPIIQDLSRLTTHKGTLVRPIFPTSLPILHMTDHTWDSILHLLQTHLSELSTNLDKRFHLPATPTFLQPDPSDPIDISPFRDALHHYSLALLGIMRDTFDYKLIAEFLDDKIRRFIRQVCLDPRSLVRADWECIKEMGFTDAEMVELVAVISEARFMGVLVYAFKAVEEAIG